MNQVTQLLNAVEQDDPYAAEQLLPLLYEELRHLATRRLAHESPGQTLQPTALVHEAYLRLLNSKSKTPWRNRAHFFAAASEAMRRILVENARRKRNIKCGGKMVRQPLEEAELLAPEPSEDLVALDEALKELARTERIAAELVQLRYFGGLAIPEAARVLGISPRTANRLWTYARAWLHDKIQGSSPESHRS